ncbi:MAG: hypothetical protein NTAFB01_04500 [Nitrospira sp.]
MVRRLVGLPPMGISYSPNSVAQIETIEDWRVSAGRDVNSFKDGCSADPHKNP